MHSLALDPGLLVMPQVEDTKAIALEFSYDELFELYEKLETIQDQLDSLTS